MLLRFRSHRSLAACSACLVDERRPCWTETSEANAQNDRNRSTKTHITFGNTPAINTYDASYAHSISTETIRMHVQPGLLHARICANML